MTSLTAKKMAAKTLAPMLIALFFIPAAFADTGDLQVRSVEYSAASNRLVASVFNQAPVAVPGPILVYFYDRDQKLGEVLYSEGVPRYSIVSVYITYTITEGEHNFRAVVDPLNTAPETLENNNEKSVTVIYTLNESVISIAPSRGAETAKQAPGGIGVYIGVFIIIVALAAFFLIKLKPGHKPLDGERRPAMRISQEKKERKPLRLPKLKFRRQQVKEEVRHETVKAIETATTEKKTATTDHVREQKEETGLVKIRNIIGMPRGERVRFRAQLSYHDKIGKDHTYFLKDETDEIVGFSKETLEKKAGIVSGTVDYFLGENTCVHVEGVE